MREVLGDQDKECSDSDPHRQKVGRTSLWNALVTKALHPADPLCRCEEAKAALNEELSGLRKAKVWDEEHPLEATDAARLHKDAVFARLFSIVGIKNSEYERKYQKFKARVVFGGDRIKDTCGNAVFFQEVGSVPSTMAAARCAVAAKALAGDSLDLLQSDCVKAYIQADLDGAPTFVRLPKEWWPDSFKGFKDPVVRLHKALYGHPRAGDCWFEKLDQTLKDEGFSTVEGWPSVWIKGTGLQNVELIIAYVDDLLMLGGKQLQNTISRLRRKIDMETPEPMSKYIGCNHRISTTGTGEDQLTQVSFDMREYFKSAVESFKNESGAKLTKAVTPFVPELARAQQDELLKTTGKYGDKAARFLMRLLYGTRLAFPPPSVAIQRLASQITKWNAECDRRLVRIHSFLETNGDMVLTGSLKRSDKSCLQLKYYPDVDLNGDIFTTKSTSGFWLELAGAEGRGMPICWGSKKQTFSAHHTQEAETVSAAVHLKKEALPTQMLLERIIGAPVDISMHEDNSACIQAIKHGYSPSLRDLPRTHRTSLGSLNEMFHGVYPRPVDKCRCCGQMTKPDPVTPGRLLMVKEPTDSQKGDVFTKHMDQNKFNTGLALLRMLPSRKS